MREQKLIASRGTGMGFVVNVLLRPGIHELCSSLLRRVVLWEVFNLRLRTSRSVFAAAPCRRGSCQLVLGELV